MAWRYLEASAVPAVVVRDGLVAFANPAAAALAGVPAERLVGRPFAEFVAPEDLELVMERQRARLAGERIPAVYEAGVVVLGRRRRVRIHAAAAGGEVVLQLLDVTDDALHGQRMEALARFGALVQNERTPDEIFQAVGRNLESLGLFCLLALPRREEVELALVATDPERLRRWEAAVGRPLQGLVCPWSPGLRAAWEDGAAFADDWDTEASRIFRVPAAGLFPGSPELHAVGARVDRAGVPWGLLVAVGPWLRSGDQPAFRLFGAQVAAALDAARAIQALSARNAELAALNRLAAASGESPDFDALLQAGGRLVRETLGCLQLAVYLVAPNGVDIELAYTSDAAEEVHRYLSRGRVDGPFLGQVVREGRSLVRLSEQLPEPARGVMQRAGIATLAAVPLRFRSAAIGLIITVWGDVRDAAGCRLPLVEAMGSHFAAAVYSHRLVADLRARVAENTQLYDDLRRSYADLAHAQAQLVQRERLAALGELAAVVAHEVRNPLGAIFNSLGALRRMVRPEGEARMLFDIVGEESDRLNAIVGDLLDFARPSQPSIRPEPVEPLLDEVLAAALAHAPPGLEVVRDIEEALPPLPSDARQLRQALLNVALNAVQAMPRGGRLTVRARRDGDALRIEVDDTGPGVPPELREKIFEPFFSTRASGTGLGLAVVRRVARDHRGTAVAEEAPGGGTALVLRLPLDAGPSPVAGRPDLGSDPAP